MRISGPIDVRLLPTPIIRMQRITIGAADSRAAVNLRGLDAQAPATQAFPDFDDNLRNAFQKEAILFFSSIVNEDRIKVPAQP